MREDEEFRYAVAGLIGYSEILKRLEEHDKKFNEILVELRDLRKAVHRHDEPVRDLARTVAAVGRKYGVVAEEALRESIRYLIEDLLNVYAVKRWEYLDSEGIVFGAPSVIEVDVLVRDKEHILVEYKAHAERGDVAELHKVGALYEKVTGVKPRLLLVASTISRRAAELAKELGVEHVTYLG